MSSFFPEVNSNLMTKIVKYLGFEFIRQSGSSHAIYFRKIDNKRTTIPIHGKQSLKRKTIKSICKDIGIEIDELINLINKI